MVSRLKRILLNSGYEVKLTTRSLGRMTNGTFCLGMIEPDNQRILIRRNVDPEERTKTLIHELIHAAVPGWEEEIVEEITLKLYGRMDDQDLGFFMYFVMDEHDASTQRLTVGRDC